jgi:hemerythrin superfamily protein
MTQQHRGDVVDLLLDQHRLIRELCDEISSAAVADREEPFRSLLRLLAVHEAVEEELVHPYVKRRVDGAKAEVDARVEEEREVNKMLAALDSLGPTNPGFEELFTRFRTALLAHADKEESSEFAGLRSATRPAERTAMAAALRLASALAPTHPHPGNESTARAVLVGTPMAMIDRARDMLRGAMAGRGHGNGSEPPAS